MEKREAEKELVDTEVLVFAKGSIANMKKLQGQCLEAEIPAMLGRPPDAGGG